MNAIADLTPLLEPVVPGTNPRINLVLTCAFNGWLVVDKTNEVTVGSLLSSLEEGNVARGNGRGSNLL